MTSFGYMDDGVEHLYAEQDRIDDEHEKFYIEQEKEAKRVQVSINLMNFIRTGNKEGLLEYIDRHNVDPANFQPGRRYDHPLDETARTGQIDIYLALADLGFKTLNPFLSASQCEQVELMKVLIERFGLSYQLSLKAENGQYGVVNSAHVHRPLLSAVECPNFAKREEMCKFLLSKGADVNERDAKGNTPLHMAAQDLDHVLTKLFIDAGADVNARNAKDTTPLLMAALRDDYDGDEDDDFTWENSYQYMEQHGRELLTVKLLLSNGADLKAKDKNGETVLHHAVTSPLLLHFLLVDLNLPPEGYVDHLFCFACEPLFFDSVQVLLDLGYSPKNFEMDELEGMAFPINVEPADNEKEFLRRVVDICSNARSLADLCCFRIRNLIGERLPTVIDDIPLPDLLKDYVRLTHIPPPPPVEYYDEYGNYLSCVRYP